MSSQTSEKGRIWMHYYTSKGSDYFKTSHSLTSNLAQIEPRTHREAKGNKLFLRSEVLIVLKSHGIEAKPQGGYSFFCYYTVESKAQPPFPIPLWAV